MVSRISESSSANVEFDAAVGWWKTQLKSMLCDETILKFECSLRRCILEKLSFHWFPETPRKGQAYRSISLDRIGRLDPILRTACHEAKISNIFDYFPYVDSITMWIDPGEVAVKTFWNYAKGGTEEIVYKKKEGTSTWSKQVLKRDFNNNNNNIKVASKRLDHKTMLNAVIKMEIPKSGSGFYRLGTVGGVQTTRSVLLNAGIWSTMDVGERDGWDNYSSLNV